MNSLPLAIFCIALFTLLSGVGDAQGFIHASRVWQAEQFHWVEALKSAVGFQFGVVMYWFALRYLSAHGIVAVEVQTIFWFGATMIGIAVLSRQFFHWSAIDQSIAVAVLIGIGWLLVRAGQRVIA